MVVMDENETLKKVHEEIDMVTTPDGLPVAMVHCNNCTSDLNAWVGIFKEFQQALGVPVDMNQLFSVLYNKALEGDVDCGGLMAYNYFSGESITGFEGGPSSAVCAYTRQQVYTCKLHENSSVHLSWLH